MAKVSNYDIVKTLFEGNVLTWDNRISLASKSQFDATGVLIASDEFTPLRNQIYNELVNRIALTKVLRLSIENPLSMFKRGKLEFGDTIQEIATDIIKGKQFRENGFKFEDQFEVFDSKVKACYHRINRQQFYPVTIEEVQIRQAFLSPNGLSDLIGALVDQMYSSNEADEFIYIKKAIDSAFNNQVIPLKDTQKLIVPDLRKDQLNSDAVKTFLIIVKSALKKMAFPTPLYNATSKVEVSKRKDLMCILNTDFTVINEVGNLSQAFKPEFMDIEVPIVGIDSFDINESEASKIVGIICDNNFINVYDTYRELATAENARALYKNYFYHVHQLYYASPFKNAIFLMVE